MILPDDIPIQLGDVIEQDDIVVTPDTKEANEGKDLKSLPPNTYVVMVHKLYSERVQDYILSFKKSNESSFVIDDTDDTKGEEHCNNYNKNNNNDQNNNSTNECYGEEDNEHDDEENISINKWIVVTATQTTATNEPSLSTSSLQVTQSPRVQVLDIPFISSGVSRSRRGYVLLRIQAELQPLNYCTSKNIDQNDNTNTCTGTNTFRYKNPWFSLSPMARKNISWIGTIQYSIKIPLEIATETIHTSNNTAHTTAKSQPPLGTTKHQNQQKQQQQKGHNCCSNVASTCTKDCVEDDQIEDIDCDGRTPANNRNWISNKSNNKHKITAKETLPNLNSDNRNVITGTVASSVFETIIKSGFQISSTCSTGSDNQQTKNKDVVEDGKSVYSTNNDRDKNNHEPYHYLRVDCYPREWTESICSKLQNCCKSKLNQQEKKLSKIIDDDVHHGNNTNESYYENMNDNDDDDPFEGPILMTMSRTKCTHRLVIVFIDTCPTTGSKSDSKTSVGSSNDGSWNMLECLWGIETRSFNSSSNRSSCIDGTSCSMGGCRSRSNTTSFCLDVPLNHDAAAEIIVVPDEYLNRKNKKRKNSMSTNSDAVVVAKENKTRSQYSEVVAASTRSLAHRSFQHDGIPVTSEAGSMESLVTMMEKNNGANANASMLQSSSSSIYKDVDINVLLNASNGKGNQLKHGCEENSSRLSDIAPAANNTNSTALPLSTMVIDSTVPLSRAYYKLEQVYYDYLQTSWKKVLRSSKERKILYEEQKQQQLFHMTTELGTSIHNSTDCKDGTLECADCDIVGLDIGASPGGWTQVLLHVFPNVDRVVAVDKGQLGERIMTLHDQKQQDRQDLSLERHNDNNKPQRVIHVPYTMESAAIKYFGLEDNRQDEDMVVNMAQQQCWKYSIMVCDASLFWVELFDLLLKNVLQLTSWNVPAIVVVTIKLPCKTLGSIQKHIQQVHEKIPAFVQSMIHAMYGTGCIGNHTNSSSNNNNNNNNNNDPTSPNDIDSSRGKSANQEIPTTSNSCVFTKMNVQARYRLVHLMANSDSERTLIVVFDTK